jgi:hypothetical protein
MTEGYPSREFELAEVITKVIELSRQGEVDSIGFLSARYRSQRDDIEWILTSLIDPGIYKCSAVIHYADGTSYNVSWQNGNVWSLSHIDADFENNPHRILPYSNGLPRHGYVSHRVITTEEEASSMLNLTGALSSFAEDVEPEGFVVPEANDVIDFMKRMEEDPETKAILDMFDQVALDIDPADLDISELCSPIMEIDPNTDKIPLDISD